MKTIFQSQGTILLFYIEVFTSSQHPLLPQIKATASQILDSSPLLQLLPRMTHKFRSEKEGASINGPFSHFFFPKPNENMNSCATIFY